MTLTFPRCVISIDSIRHYFRDEKLLGFVGPVEVVHEAAVALWVYNLYAPVSKRVKPRDCCHTSSVRCVTGINKPTS